MPWAWQGTWSNVHNIKTCSAAIQRGSYLEQFEFCSQTLPESARSVLLPCRLLKWVQQASEHTVFPSNCRAPSPFYSASAIYKGTVWLQHCRRGIHSMTKFVTAEKTLKYCPKLFYLLGKTKQKSLSCTGMEIHSMQEIRHSFECL